MLTSDDSEVKVRVLTLAEIDKNVDAYFNTCSDEIRQRGECVFQRPLSVIDWQTMRLWMRELSWFLQQDACQTDQPYSIEEFAWQLHLALRELLYNQQLQTSQAPYSTFLRKSLRTLLEVMTGDLRIAEQLLAQEYLANYREQK